MGVDVEIIGGGIVGLKHSSVGDLTVQLHGSAEATARRERSGSGRRTTMNGIP